MRMEPSLEGACTVCPTLNTAATHHVALNRHYCNMAAYQTPSMTRYRTSSPALAQEPIERHVSLVDFAVDRS